MCSMQKVPICENDPVDEGMACLEDRRERGKSEKQHEKVALPAREEPVPKILSLDVSDDLTQRNWAKMMDCTRARFGHDEKASNGKCRTYYRFTLSPSLGAGYSLGSLRAYAKAWAEESFRSNGNLHEYAIVCQRDAGCLQASVIVNATNKETGKKLRIWKRGRVDLSVSAREMGKERCLGPVDLGIESFHDPVQESTLAPASSRKRAARGNGRRPKAASNPKGTEVVSIRMRASEAEAVDAAASAAGVSRSEYIRSRLGDSAGVLACDQFLASDLICALNSQVDALGRFVKVNSSVQRMLASKIDGSEGSDEEGLDDLKEALRDSEMQEDQALDIMGEYLDELEHLKSMLKGG